MLTGGYAPQGWETNERRVVALQEKLMDLLDGKSSIPITTGTANAQPRFVPPPGFPPPPA